MCSVLNRILLQTVRTYYTFSVFYLQYYVAFNSRVLSIFNKQNNGRIAENVDKFNLRHTMCFTWSFTFYIIILMKAEISVL